MNTEVVNLNLIESVMKVIELDSGRRFSTLNLISVLFDNQSILANDYSAVLLSHFTNGDFTLRLENYHKCWSLKNRRRFYNTYLVDSSASFNKLLEQISHDRFNNDGYFMFVVINGSLANIPQIFQKLWMKFIYNVIVLIEDENSIKLLTFFPYFSNHCNDTKPFEINQFKNGSFKVQHFLHFPNKFHNLFECPVKIGTHSTPPSVIGEKFGNGSFQLNGYDIELLNELANTMNFMKDIDFITGKAPWGRIYDNGSSSGALKRAINGDVDMIIGNYFLYASRLELLSASRSYFSNLLTLIVPPGIRNHYFNIMLLFVGGTQHIIPQRNFSRFLLMMFLLFCLVQRTIYQGYLFHFLQSDNRAKEVSTIDEMIENNFDFYLYDSFQEFTQSMKLYERRKILDDTSFPEYLNKVTDPAFNSALCVSLSKVSYEIQHNHRHLLIPLIY
ncbi:unnamed protein product [Diamesa serratosioi]